MASKKLDLKQNIQRIAQKSAQSEAGEIVSSMIYPVSTRSDAPELPALAGTLSERMQEIARQYVGARRRSGEALLEAARWLSEARTEALHGEWGTFLEATNTSDDAAERLLNIHRQAMQNPQFAEAVRTDWIGQSAAALLAQPSTPPEVVAEVLASPEPPTVAEVRKKVGQARGAPAQRRPERGLGEANNPQFADSREASDQPNAQVIAVITADRALQMLQDAAALIRDLASIANTIPVNTAAAQAIQDIEQGSATIRRVLSQTPYDEI